MHIRNKVKNYLEVFKTNYWKSSYQFNGFHIIRVALTPFNDIFFYRKYKQGPKVKINDSKLNTIFKFLESYQNIIKSIINIPQLLYRAIIQKHNFTVEDDFSIAWQ